MADEVVHEEQPGGTYKHWEPSLNKSIWRLEWTPPHNNPFTPEGHDVIIENWANQGIDVSASPPIGVQITPPYPNQPPVIEGSVGGTYPTSPPPAVGGIIGGVVPPVINVTPPENGNGGETSSLGLAFGALGILLILGGLKL